MKKNYFIPTIILVVLLVFVLSTFNWGKETYNKMIIADETVKTSWSNVENLYQRRYDLIPNLVNIVKGYAKHERETFQAVTEARSKVGGVINLQASDLTPEKMVQFQQAQIGLMGALQRLMVVIERYPDLKANQNFLNLQTELTETENGIAKERLRYNETARQYNQLIRSFPQTVIARMFGFAEKPYFQADKEAQKASRVEF